MDIGDRLRQARAKAGKTQEQVAHDAQMNITQYNGYERGRSRPAPATLERLATALQTSVAELSRSAEVEDEEQSTRSSIGEGALAQCFDQFKSDVASLLALPIERVSVHLEIR
jgi:transcriptional regulator with XRE-family HTH domain